MLCHGFVEGAESCILRSGCINLGGIGVGDASEARDMFRLDEAIHRKDAGPLYDVFKFPHIPRPGVPLDPVQGFRAEGKSLPA